ncbi:RNA-binding protein [Candidatus Bathyarchaeota archaeon]|nr:RNA-binding protein [Candidatus Bathyarchaeota archaeon]MBS7630664.1 RNA-binding protein [Candidatus Bathyarchaeota archaeon]
MSKNFETRDLVIPGDLIFEGNIRTGENTYRHQGKVYATRIGLVEYGHDMVSVIALEAGYVPLVGDLVIGEVIDLEADSWIVDINAPSDAVLNVQDAIGQPYKPDIEMPKILDVGETMVAKIVELDRKMTPILSILGKGLGKVEEGLLLKLTPSKIPRLIGKKGSMVNMILKETGCNIIIGQNGRILVSCKNRKQEEIVVKVIDKIEKEAHTTGLTNRIQNYIKELKGEDN